MKHHSYALVLCLLATTATAAPSPSLDVVGLGLGSEYKFPQCSLHKLYGRNAPKFYSTVPSGTSCWKYETRGPEPGSAPPATYRAVLTLSGNRVPSGMRWQNIRVLVVEGRIAGVRIETSGLKVQNDILQRLTEKYGTPAEVVRTKLQNNMGATFEDITAVWVFDDLRVVLVGMANRIDTGVVSVLTPAAIAFEDAEVAAKKGAEPKL